MGRRRGRPRLVQGNIACTHGGGVTVSTQLSQIAPKAQLDRKAAFYLAGPLAHAGIPQGDLGNDEPSRSEWDRRGKYQAVRERVGDNEFRTSVHGSKPAPTVHHRSGGSKYPKGRARPGRGRSGYRRSRIDWCNGRWRASSKRSSRRTFIDCSYGFRPRRNPHHALQSLREQIVTMKVRQISLGRHPRILQPH